MTYSLEINPSDEQIAAANAFYAEPTYKLNAAGLAHAYSAWHQLTGDELIDLDAIPESVEKNAFEYGVNQAKYTIDRCITMSRVDETINFDSSHFDVVKNAD